MPRGLYLGIDCGTQGTKALVLDETGSTRGAGRAPHALVERSSGAREQEPAWWVEAMRVAIRQSLETVDASKLRAVAISGQQHGLVVLDEHLKVIRPAKLWNDTETAAENQEIVALLGGEAECISRLGIIPRTGYTVSKLLWLARHEPEHFDRVRSVMLPHEYLNFWLTGRMCSEAGDASGTGYFDPRSLSWNEEVLSLIDGGSGQLRRGLPEIIGPDQTVGTLLPDVAREFGLPEDCIVGPGGGDNMMGAIGTGNVREGIVTLSLGTSATVYSFRSLPSGDRTGCVAPFCASSGGWLPLVCTMNATNVVTQTLKLVGREVAYIETALDSTQAGAGALTMVPFFNGERTPDLPQASGTLIGINANNFTAENLIRAAIEGVSFGILEGLSLILQGSAPDRVRLIGGGSRSKGWRQLLADASGAVIEVPAEEEAGCLGAAIQAFHVDSVRLGEPTTLESTVESWIKLEESKTVYPRNEFREAYGAAQKRYREVLQDLYFPK